MALTNKLSAIGDAIREKTGKSELLTLDAMPGEIASIETGGGGSIEVEPIVLTGNCDSICAYELASNYMKLFGDTITTKDITNANKMFQNNTNEVIPFDINISDSATYCQCGNLFFNCNNLRVLPKIQGNGKIPTISWAFFGCYNLREVPNDYFDKINIDDWATSQSTSTGAVSYLFNNCYSLRSHSFPFHWFKKMNPNVSYSNTYYSSGFSSCYALDELVNLPVPYITTAFIYNAFNNIVYQCHRLKNLTFELDENDNPIVVKWKNQTIDLQTAIGYGYKNNILNYNSGITADKEVIDDATYQALKNDPDWFTTERNYSRYNHDSAVYTINTLPDTSAYLATAGGTNTIKFIGAVGALTDGGAINTLTEEEIAVATAKGWTIAMS